MYKSVFICLLSLTLTACAGTKTLGGDPSIQVVKGTEFPAPDRTDLIGEDRPYLIGPFDKLTIDVFGIEDLSKKEVQTDASGRISFPWAVTTACT